MADSLNKEPVMSSGSVHLCCINFYVFIEFRKNKIICTAELRWIVESIITDHGTNVYSVTYSYNTRTEHNSMKL